MTEVETLRAALQEILTGSQVTGRWIDQLNYEAIEGGVESEVPEGFYDQHADEPVEDDPDEMPEYPEGTDIAITGDLLLVGGEWIRPAIWEPYNRAEQGDWLDSVTGICERALGIAPAVAS